jgi:exopolysaccharide biosynthesis polyprenyl glycosylphosphotransferase
VLRRSSTNYTVLLLFCDLCLTEAALHLASLARRLLPFGVDLGAARTAYLPIGVYLMVGGLWLVVFVLLSVYDLRRSLKLGDELQRAVVAIAIATLVFAGALYFSFREVPRLLFGYFFLLDLALLVGSRVAIHRWFVHARPRLDTVRVLIAGAGNVGRQVASAVGRAPNLGLCVVGFVDDDPDKQGTTLQGLPVLGTLAEASHVVQTEDIHQVIVALPLRAHGETASLATDLQSLPIDVKVVPDFFDLAFHHASIDHVGGIPLIGLRDPAIDGVQRVVKRIFDLVIAVSLMVLLAPFMLAVTLLIKLDSKGPAIFKQRRIGENCEPFSVYKFRSMVQDAEAQLSNIVVENEQGKIEYKFKDDPRVTRVGRVLRRSSMDELPQLLNVIKGEMSLVGPRPELPFLVERYEPWERKRFAVPPGMTGWWQIRGRSDRPMHLHVDDDLFYIRNYSLLLDMQILLKTIGVVLRGRGAY